MSWLMYVSVPEVVLKLWKPCTATSLVHVLVLSSTLGLRSVAFCFTMSTRSPSFHCRIGSATRAAAQNSIHRHEKTHGGWAQPQHHRGDDLYRESVLR